MNCQTKFRLVISKINAMKNIQIRIFLLLLTTVFYAQVIRAQVPERPQPARLVNDLANVFSAEQQAALEQALVTFNDSTSNQIAIVTLKDLGGYDKAQLAQEIGEKWGVGQQKFDNGIVILLKPKNETKGEVFIATGYGLEGALPDAICKRIVENEMIPYFRRNDYYGGVVNALRVIMPVATGEYKYKAEKKGGGSVPGLIGILFFLVVVFIISRNNRNNGDFTGRGGVSKGLDLWSLIFLAGMSNRSHSGSWGGFSGGGGSGGNSGFGGFGGGSFGGGGAGGSW